METRTAPADVNIHLRACVRDRDIIDQAAEMAGTNRSQFMLASALKEAKNLLLDQSTLLTNAENFQKVMDWMDKAPTPPEEAGMQRLIQTQSPWHSG
jgi:uncharacterized protein (DUF1778 family)